MTPQSSDLAQTILNRRSVRTGYVERAVPREVLEHVVACGLAAPSSKASNPLRLTVVTDRARLNRLARMVKSAPRRLSFTPHDPATGAPRPEWRSTVEESAEVLAQAPTAIFVENAGPFSGGRRALLDATAPSRELGIIGFELEIAGLGAALENMWLAAMTYGLSAAFLGDVGVAEVDLKQDLGIRGDLLGALVVGYADDSGRRSTRPDISRVRWNPNASSIGQL